MSANVSQVLAGVAKIFVGEIIEKGVFQSLYPRFLPPINHTLTHITHLQTRSFVRSLVRSLTNQLVRFTHSPTAREIQEIQGETGPLTPDHLRKAYRWYVDEYGWVGPARPLKGKKLFVR